MTIAELRRDYAAKRRSPVDVTEEALAKIERLQPSLNAFITILADAARAAAKASEERFRRGEPLGPLDGMPVGIKDLIHMEGVRTTAASKILADYVAPNDSDVIRRLKAGGAVILGKTNLHEFAYGPTGDVSYFGPARNPWNADHITGGSSSGSGAAVAAGICPMALGSDTGGSIRIPASMCGIVGLKPTYGRVFCDDVLPLAWSMDHLGPLTATVEDAGLSLAAMSDFRAPELSDRPARPFRIGVCRELFFDPMQAEVRPLVERALPDLGELREVRIPHIALAPFVTNVIMASEAMAFHKQWIETRYDDYQKGQWTVPHRLQAALEIKAIDYVQANRLRGLLIDEMREALADVDVLAMPTLPVSAPRFDDREVTLENGGSFGPQAVITRNTAPINVTGFPAISLPCGATGAGLPVGLQLVARPWEEALLLQVAYAFEGRGGHEPKLPAC